MQGKRRRQIVKQIAQGRQRPRAAGRRSGVEVLEVRWLLAVDVSPYQSLAAASNAAAVVAYPTVRVLHSGFFAVPNG